MNCKPLNFAIMKKSLFKILAKLNRRVMPRYSDRDLSRLNKIDKIIIAWRYYVTINSL